MEIEHQVSKRLKLIFSHIENIENYERFITIPVIKTLVVKVSNSIGTSFRTCLLLTGVGGSGKTQQLFLASGVNSNRVNMRNNYYIFIDSTNYSISLGMESWIINKVCKALKLECNTEKEFYELLEGNRVYLIVDDVNKMLSHEMKFYEELVEFISDSTRKGIFYFILSTPYYRIFEVLNDNVSLSKYSMIESDSLTNLDGWIDISSLNKKYELGSNILKRNSKLNISNIVANDNSNYLDLIVEPYFAWRVVALEDTLPNRIGSLSYLKFNKKYSEYVDSKVNNEHVQFKLEIDLLIADIIYQVRECGHVNIEKRHLINNVISKECEPYPYGSDKLSKAIDILCNLDLLRNICNKTNERFTINNTSFWSYRIIESIDKNHKASILFGHVSKYKDSSILPDFVSMCMQKLDDDDNKQSKLFIQKLSNSRLLTKILHVAVNLRTQTQKNIVDAIEPISKTTFSNYDLFNYIYFIANTNNKSLHIEQKINKLIEVSKRVEDLSMKKVFIYECKKVIENINDLTTLKNCIKYMYSCNVPEISNEIARITSQRYILLIHRLIENDKQNINVTEDSITERFLSPLKEILRKEGHTKRILKSLNEKYEDGKSLLHDYITPEELWACTSCNACVQACPVNIDPLKIIMELRQYMVMEESSSPTELNGMFTRIENNGAPWQFPPSDRLKWVDQEKT